MKKQIYIYILGTLFISNLNVQAQSNKVTGIFSSANDFKAGVLKSYNINKIKVDVFLNTSDIIVYENGIKTKIKKSSIFGYQNSKKENYRFYNNIEYKIIDTGNVCLYSEYHYENPVKGKGGMIKVEKIHFSVTLVSAIFSFTKENILKNFPESTRLRMWLLNSSSKVEELLQKDSNGKLLIQNLIVN